MNAHDRVATFPRWVKRLMLVIGMVSFVGAPLTMQIGAGFLPMLAGLLLGTALVGYVAPEMWTRRISNMDERQRLRLNDAYRRCYQFVPVMMFIGGHQMARHSTDGTGTLILLSTALFTAYLPFVIAHWNDRPMVE